MLSAARAGAAWAQPSSAPGGRRASSPDASRQGEGQCVSCALGPLTSRTRRAGSLRCPPRGWQHIGDQAVRCSLRSCCDASQSSRLSWAHRAPTA
eukprot:3470368-Prymnesium_polylepis.2